MRAGQRVRLERGISRDATGYAIRVSVGTGAARRIWERRYPPDADLARLRTERAQLEADLRTAAPLAAPGGRPTRGGFAADVRAYLRRMQPQLDRATWRSRRSELRAWGVVFQDRPRSQIRRAQVEQAIRRWRTTRTPKTIRNRVRALAHLWRTLDGPRAPCPVDGVRLPRVPRTTPRPVDRAVLRTVLARLIRAERRGALRTARTRARYLVLVTTGQRPAQLRRTRSTDVDLARGIWYVPAAKGGNPVPLPLNGDMRAAWTLFARARAWGAYDGRSFARTLHRAGWPVGVRLYDARHTVGIALSEGGSDLGDIQAWMGHRRIQTTRDFYVPGLPSRLAHLAAELEGRLGRTGRAWRWAPNVGTTSDSRESGRRRRRSGGGLLGS